MDLEAGACLSGFDNLMSLFSGMRGPLDQPAQGKWYRHLYTAYVTFINASIFFNFLTIAPVFLSPGVSIEVRCFTGFPTVAMFLALFRRTDMCLKREKCKDLTAHYLSLYGDSSELNAEVKRYGKIIKNISRILFLLTALPMVTIDLIPAFVALRGGPRALGVPAMYPFDTTKFIFVFCFLCFFQSAAACQSPLSVVVFNNTFNMFAFRQLALTRHLSRELLRILSIARVDRKGVVTFQTQDGAQISKEEASQKILTDLRQWVKNHQQSIRMVNDLQDIYSVALFVEFVFAGSVLCMCAFVIANVVGGVVKVFFCGLYVFGLMMELLITCLLGNLILHESNSLESMIEGTHIYTLNSNVYNKWLRIILTKAKVPTRLVAVGVFPLDVETFKSLMMTTYSFFTLLKTLK